MVYTLISLVASSAASTHWTAMVTAQLASTTLSPESVMTKKASSSTADRDVTHWLAAKQLAIATRTWSVQCCDEDDAKQAENTYRR